MRRERRWGGERVSVDLERARERRDARLALGELALRDVRHAVQVRLGHLALVDARVAVRGRLERRAARERARLGALKGLERVRVGRVRALVCFALR